MEIKGSKVLVTGANRGLGRAFVAELLARGAERVYAAARSPSSLDEATLKDSRVVAVALDVTNAADIEAAARSAGDIDLLINNAGTLKAYGILDATQEQLDEDLAVNFFGALNVTKAFAPALEKSKGGVVNLLTLVALTSMSAIGGYSASKAAAWSMTQSLRVELGKKGITVFGVYPGAVDTDMIRAFEMAKTPPREVAANALDAVEANVLDCFPDPMSKQAGAAWLEDPRALERMFAEM